MTDTMTHSIVREVNVNRTRTPQEALDVTAHNLHTRNVIVDNIPKGEGDKVEVVFFALDLSGRNGYISDDDLEKEFELRRLKPADLYSLAAVNEADLDFSNEKPNGTHWKDEKGNWCSAVFVHWGIGRHVLIRDGEKWDDRWWFAGLA